MNRTVLVLRLREYAALNDDRWSLQRTAADVIENLEAENAQLAATIRALEVENTKLRACQPAPHLTDHTTYWADEAKAYKAAGLNAPFVSDATKKKRWNLK